MDYASNSHRSKEEGKAGEKTTKDKKIEPVVTGKVIEKKPTVGTKVKTLFFGGEARGVAQYLMMDVLVPAIRNMIADAGIEGVKRMVFGDTIRSQRRTPGYSGSRVQYNNPLWRDPRDSRERGRLPEQGAGRQARPESNDIILASRQDAETVLERMVDIVENYECVSRADLYELIELPSSHIDNKWGWSDLRSATIKQVREGYLLDLPPEEEI